MTVALVLSGGGSRGAFEVGAALFLYDRYQVRPDIICGTSVGAINGAKLAEGGTAAEKRTALEELKDIWLGMMRNSDMWEEAAWLAELGDLRVGQDTLRNLLIRQLTGQEAPTSNGPPDFIRLNAPWLYNIRDMAGAVYVGIGALATLSQVRQKAEQGQLRSVLRLRPMERKMRGIVETSDTVTMEPPKLDSLKVQRSGVKLRLALVSLETGALRYVTEAGQLLDRDNRTPVLVGEPVSIPNPACATIAARVQRLQNVLDELLGQDPPWPATRQQQITRLQSDLAAARTDLDTCERTNPPTQGVAPAVDIVRGIMASASVPAIFEPVRIGDEYYVDGGVREIAPVRIAFDVGGNELEHVYVVMASALNVPRAPSFARADFPTVLMYSLVNLGLNEIARDDTSPPGGWPKPCDVIAPSFDIYELPVIDPGLIRVHMDYGFMRAADVARHAPLPSIAVGTGTGNTVGGGPPSVLPGPGIVVGPVPPRSSEPVRDSDLTPEQAMRLSDAVTLLRLAAWDAEFSVFSQPHFKLIVPLLPFQPAVGFAALPWIRLLKWLVKAVVDFRTRHSLPAPQWASDWWLKWEAHPWLPAEPTSPWEALDTPFGRVEAVAFNNFLPQNALIREPLTGAVYRLVNGARIWIPNPAEFERMGLQWADVRDLPPGVADCLPLEQT